MAARSPLALLEPRNPARCHAPSPLGERAGERGKRPPTQAPVPDVMALPTCKAAGGCDRGHQKPPGAHSGRTFPATGPEMPDLCTDAIRMLYGLNTL